MHKPTVQFVFVVDEREPSFETGTLFGCYAVGTIGTVAALRLTVACFVQQLVSLVANALPRCNTFSKPAAFADRRAAIRIDDVFVALEAFAFVFDAASRESLAIVLANGHTRAVVVHSESFEAGASIWSGAGTIATLLITEWNASIDRKIDIIFW